MIPTILSIAGSDPTGGAGIQADLKTITSLGCYAAAAITAVTVQNSHGVQLVYPLSPDLVQQQIQAVLADHKVSHVKIGMIGSVEIAAAIAVALQGFTGEIIYDPVLKSTTRQNLLVKSEKSDDLEILLKKVTVLTPNLPELEQITGHALTDNDAAILQCGQQLFNNYKALQAIIIKGGHTAGRKNICDFLLYRGKEVIKIEKHTHNRIQTRNSHGTGCTLASAFAAYHCRFGNYLEAFTKSCDYLHKLLVAGRKQQIILSAHGKGPLFHGLVDSNNPLKLS